MSRNRDAHSSKGIVMSRLKCKKRGGPVPSEPEQCWFKYLMASRIYTVLRTTKLRQSLDMLTLDIRSSEEAWAFDFGMYHSIRVHHRSSSFGAWNEVAARTLLGISFLLSALTDLIKKDQRSIKIVVLLMA